MNLTPPVTFMLGLMNIFQNNIQSIKDTPLIPRAITVKSVFADTLKGRVKGVQEVARGNQKYSFFRGIPYAKAPTGKLRYEPPIPHPGWEDTLNATWYGAECWQITVGSSEKDPELDEDCLFINVATRRSYLKGQVQKERLRPVFVWIHGGQFMVGSANLYEPKYFMEHDIVFVNFNYRLNSFGFLNTGDGVVSGNMGLKDQTLALKWVQENIEFFNGDPTRVTIIGESAGAAAVHMHTMSPMSRGLFAGAVSLSGTALSPWALIRDPRTQMEEFAAAFECAFEDSKEMIKCLKKVPPDLLIDFHSSYVQDEAQGERAFFGPTVDSNSTNSNPPFLLDHPLVLLENTMIQNTPWIYGVTSGEGLINIMPIYKSDSLRKELNKNWDKHAPGLLFYKDHPNSSQISKAARRYYLKDKPFNQESLADAVTMASDRSFYYGSHESALLQSKIADVYAYYYVYEGLFSASTSSFEQATHSTNVNVVPTPILGTTFGSSPWIRQNSHPKKPKNLYGICHGDELPILFKWPFLRKEISDKDDVDYKFSKRLINLLVSFGEFGVPQLRVYGEDVDWPSIRETNPFLYDKPLKMLMLNKTWSIIDEPFYPRAQFWARFDTQEYREMFLST